MHAVDATDRIVIWSSARVGAGGGGRKIVDANNARWHAAFGVCIDAVLVRLSSI